MIFFRKIRNLTILITVFLIASTATTVWSQIITLAELTKDFDISNMVSLKISGSYKLESGETLDKAVKAIVTNSLDTSIDKVHLTVLLSKSLPSLKSHVETMGDLQTSSNKEVYTYTEEVSPDSSASDEQYLTFTKPIRKHNKNRNADEKARREGTFVATLFDGSLPLPASGSINILRGKEIKLNKEITSGIYRLAIVLSHPDKSGISLKPKITKMHYLIVRHDEKAPDSK